MNTVTPIPNKEQTADDLCAIYQQRKIELAKAKKAFDEIESELLDRIGHKEEGSTTFGFDQFKITTIGKVNRTVDSERIWNVKASIEDDLFNLLFTFKPSLNLAAYKKLQQSSPETYNIVASCITAKPGKPSLKVEPRGDLL